MRGDHGLALAGTEGVCEDEQQVRGGMAASWAHFAGRATRCADRLEMGCEQNKKSKIGITARIWACATERIKMAFVKTLRNYILLHKHDVQN